MSNLLMLGRGLIGALLFSLVLPVLLPAYSVGGVSVAYGQSVVRDIRVKGNRRIEPETVLSYLHFGPGDRYDEGKIDSSLKSLFSTGLFSDVRIHQSKGTVVITVVENPVISHVAFEGNYEVEDSSLKTEVQLKPRSVFTRARVQADVQRILGLYRQQGRFAARVEPKIINLSHNRVNLVYEIDEGPNTKVKSINFIGNRAFSDSQLEDLITTTETGLLSFLKPTNIYDPDRLNLDRELLRQFYLKNGYADIRIISATADLDREGNGFFITFTVEEGELYTFGDIRVETSLKAVDPEALRTELLTQTGKIYNAASIDKSTEKLTLKVAELGYAFARVRPRVDRDPVARTVGLSYMIEEGPRVYIERINIVGNTRTRDYVIRREFRLVEGDAFNRLLVDRAKRRLKALGFFEKVTISREPGSAQDRVILNVTLVEKSTGELSFGGGYSSAEGVIGDISISERNLLGRGQFLRLKFAGSLERYTVDLSFTEPRFLDRNIAAGFDLFHKETDYSSESSFKSRKTGGNLRATFPLSDTLAVTAIYSFSRDEVFDVGANASLAVQQAKGTALTSSVGYRLLYDTRNHKRAPNRGLYIAFSQDLAGVGGDVNYLRTSAEVRAYYPVFSKVTLVGRVIGGHITGFRGDDVRLIDHFYRGGETVRGFDRAGFGPRAAGSSNDALGGTIFYAGTVEARFPLPLLSEELGLSAAVFADAGTLFDAENVAGTTVNDSSAIRSSVGVGLLWNSPVGPLRADYAHVLSSEKEDEKEAFRFGASTKF